MFGKKSYTDECGTVPAVAVSPNGIDVQYAVDRELSRRERERARAVLLSIAEDERSTTHDRMSAAIALLQHQY